jgi:class 3 adenylate cyclase
MIREFFLEGGYGMYVLVVIGLAAMVVGGWFAAGEERGRWPAWILVALCVVAGAGFTVQGRSLTDDAVMAVDPAMREQIIEQGYKEANRPLQFGIGLAIVGAVVAGVGEMKRRKS